MDTIVPQLLSADAATKYMFEVLVTGGANRSLLRENCSSIGPLYAVAPEGTSMHQLLSFDSGGILMAPPSFSDGQYLIQAVPTTLAATALIVWSAWMQCDQPKLWIHEALLTEEQVVQEGLQYEHVGEAIYLTYDGISDVRRLAELLGYSLLSWHFLAFVTDGPNEFESVDELIACARFILIGAYDGESFLYAAREPGGLSPRREESVGG